MALAGAVVAAGLGACSGSDGPTKASAPSTAPVVASTIAPTKPQRQIPADRDIVEVPALRKTIALTGCQAVDKGWSGVGTAKNTGSDAKTYHILVFFTDKYSRTIDYAKTDVKVAAGQSATWKAATSFDPPAGTQCVLRGLSESKA